MTKQLQLRLQKSIKRSSKTFKRPWIRVTAIAKFKQKSTYNEPIDWFLTLLYTDHSLISK